MFSRMTELPSLLISDGLPVGLGVAASALASSAAYNAITQAFTGQAWAPWAKIGFDLVSTSFGLIAAGMTDDALRKFFIGWAGFAAIGFVQAVIFRATGFDLLGSISHTLPPDPGS